MATPKLNVGGVRSLLGNPVKLDQAVKERPAELVRELATAVATIPIAQIETNAGQPRKHFESESLEELASSIKAHGIIQPITVRYIQDKKYQIISGERRFRASQLAGLKELPAYVRLANDQELLEMALIENIQREDLNAWEVAISYGRLVDEFKLTHEKLSDRVGKQRSTITNYLRLLKFEGDEDIKRGLIEDKISMGHARALAGLDDFAFRNGLYHEIVKKDLSVRAVEELIAEKNQGSKPRPNKSLPKQIQDIENQFNAFFGGKVSLKRDESGKGQITIKFRNDADLNKLIDLIESKSGSNN